MEAGALKIGRPRALLPSREAEFVLGCARAYFNGEPSGALAALAEPSLDWERVIGMALHHGVMPLVYRQLGCLDNVPAEVRARLRGIWRTHAIRSFLLTTELLRVVESLGRRGVPAIPFKGPVLAATGYGDVNLRQFADLDILIRRQDLESAMDFFAAQGYRPWRKLSENEEAAHLGSEHAWVFVSGDGRVRIDLHWRIAQRRYSFALEPKSLWARAQSVAVVGRQVRTLHPEDLLTVLLLHGSKHLWSRLVWVCDVAAVLRSSPALNWDGILECSRRMQTERVFLLGLGLARDLVGAVVPDEIASRMPKDPMVGALSRKIQQRLMSDWAKPMGPAERVALFLTMRERVRSKLPYLLYEIRRSVLPNKRDFDLLALPRFLHFLYYPVRAVRLAAQYGLGAFLRLCSSR